jgi:hypothetical protein
MPLTREDMDRRIDEHFGFEAQDDIAGVLATMAADVEHDVVGWPTGPVRGRDDSVWRGRAPGRPFGLEGRGRPLEFRLLHVVEFADDGAIRRENVWVDLAAIFQQLPQD